MDKVRFYRTDAERVTYATLACNLANNGYEAVLKQVNLITLDWYNKEMGFLEVSYTTFLQIWEDVSTDFLIYDSTTVFLDQ